MKHVGIIYEDYVILGHGLEERQLLIFFGVFVRDISMINYDMLWLSALECGKSRLFAEGCNFCWYSVRIFNLFVLHMVLLHVQCLLKLLHRLPENCVLYFSHHVQGGALQNQWIPAVISIPRQGLNSCRRNRMGFDGFGWVQSSTLRVRTLWSFF